MATTYSVGLQFTAKTQQLDAVYSKLNKLERDLGRLKGSDPFQGVENSARDAGNATEKAGKQARAATGAFKGLGSAIGGLVSAAALMQGAKFVFGKTAELETQTRSIQVLTGSLIKAKDIVGQLQQYANVTPFTSAEIIDTAKRLSAFGVSADKVVDTTKRLGDVAGATGANLGELSLAYGQVMAKGRLQGEELLQFQERGVALADELKRMYKLSGQEFSDALSKGRVSAEAVEVALKNLTNAGGQYANGAISQSDTLNGRLSTLQDAVDGVARAVGKVLTPAVLNALETANDRLAQTPALVEDIGLAFQYAADKLSPFINGLSQMHWFFKNLTPPGWAMQVIGGSTNLAGSAIKEGAERQRAQGGYVSRFAGARDEAFRRAQQIGSVPTSALTPPPLLGGEPGGGKAGGGGGSKAGKGASASSFQPSSRAKALIAAASKLGVSPLDLATIISFETGGTFSPSIVGGAGGNYMGLIQFGPSERRQYGAHRGQSFEEQVQGPVVRYFQSRFGGVGMSTQGASLEDLYTTVIAGNPKANRNARDSFGTSARSGVAAMGPHRQKALQTFFGGNPENAGYDASSAGADAAQGWEDEQKRMEALREMVAQRQQELEVLRSGLAIAKELDPIKRSELELAGQKLAIEQKYADALAQSKGQEETDLLNKNRALELEILGEQQAAKRFTAMQGITEQLDAQLRGVMAITPEQQAINQLLEYENQLKQEGIALTDADKQALLGKIQAIQAANEAQKAQQAAQQQAESDASGIASTLTGGIKDAIKAAVTGGDVKAALSGMLASLGEKFLDMAMRPLEQMLTQSLTRMFNPQAMATQANTMALQANTMALQSAAIGGGGGFGGAGGILGGLGSLFGGGGMWGAASGVAFNPIAFTPGLSFFADGGFVTGPTPAVVGEGGANEYVIPENKMGGAMARWNAGARGDSVISGADPTGRSGGTALAEAPPQVNITGGILNFNDSHYIRADQVPSIISQSAKQGEARALRKLQQSPGARRKVGI